MISAKFFPLKYYTLSSQLPCSTVECSGRRILSPGQIAIVYISLVHALVGSLVCLFFRSFVRSFQARSQGVDAPPNLPKRPALETKWTKN